jgi:hypothetical protein
MFIPVADAELSIDYYICYLAKKEKWLRPFLTWAEKRISGFEKE